MSQKKVTEGGGWSLACGEQTLSSAPESRREREKQKPKKGSALRRLGGVGNDIVFFSLAIQITKTALLSTPPQKHHIPATHK